jgi:GNAT superfamily N-acetyltransferase
MYFDANYRERATLADGRCVELRLVRPDDKELLLRGFRRQSPESRYRRFFQDKDELSEWELAYLTVVDGVDHFAIGAVEPFPDGSEEGRGIARFVRLKDRPDAAEAAIAVDDEVQGRGLGRLLFARLAAAARERGIARLRCDILAYNDPMRAIIESTPEAVVEDNGLVLSVELPVPEIAPDQTPAAAPRSNPLYRLFVSSAEGLVAVRRLFDKLRRGD